MDDLQQAFVSEAQDVLEDLETALLGLDGDPQNRGLVDAAFRALHTLKGSGSMAGFAEVERFAHQLESAFDDLRNGVRVLDAHLLTLALESLDHLSHLVRAGPSPEVELVKASDVLLESLAPKQPEPSGARVAWLLLLAPEPDLLSDGLDPAVALNELSELGEVLFVGKTCDPPLLEDLNPQHLHFRWWVLLLTDQHAPSIEEVLCTLHGRVFIDLEAVARNVPVDTVATLRCELLEDLEAESREGLADHLRNHGAEVIDTARPRGLSPADPDPKPSPPQTAEPEGRDVGPTALSIPVPERRPAVPSEDTIKVPASRLDTLVDQVGEMVALQARVLEIARRYRDPELDEVIESLERVCTDIRDGAMDLRMVPIGSTLARFQRLVRDVSNQLGKSVRLVIEGEDTELDKTVVERLGDPLVHLVRNSLDHGLESPEERSAQGKAAEGTLWLSARHSQTRVSIEVRDDGRGLNTERIRTKAIERGVIDPRADLSETDLQELIFAPGFSTASSVSSLSGRGVGMDAVRSVVESLRGSITVDSVAGEGTSIRIELPVTLAVIDGLLVELGSSRFVLPLVQVEECIEIPAERRSRHNFTELRGELVPYFPLQDWIGTISRAAEHQQVVITQQDGERFGLVVDNVVGQQQTVIKSLGKAFGHVDGISGATILGNGEIALILDPLRVAYAIQRGGQRREDVHHGG